MTLLVMGSVNRDITAQLPEFPQPGETLLATGSETATGGKSANQAVAAAMVGARAHLIARCGSDAAGAEAVRSLREVGVHVDAVTPGRAAQGTAFIAVRTDGENTIVVVPGANAELRAQDCPQHLLEKAEWILLSLEVPLATVLETAARARAAGVKVALNASPSPGQPLDLRDVDLVIVNEGEAAALLAGAGAAEPGSQPEDLAAALGLETLIVTRGAAGASIHACGHATVQVPSVVVQAVDTSGAGDAFTGALLGRITCGDSLETASAIAARFAASATTRVGAQASYPRDFQVDEPSVFTVARDS
ncbi:ribokinase [Nesterenkonia aurantiaca]|uniref:ribokinase n=1 Tax=Nesterenkonia aurantiaca TaxID=1436010 RepID=UPI003EE719AE